MGHSSRPLESLDKNTLFLRFSPQDSSQCANDGNECGFHGWLTCHCSSMTSFQPEESTTNDSADGNETT